MYSKVYWITSDPGSNEGLMQHYDDSIAPAIRASEFHVGHQMIEIRAGKFILISDYKSAEAAQAALPMVQELVAPMAERYGMKLDVIGEGETVRDVS